MHGFISEKTEVRGIYSVKIIYSGLLWMWIFSNELGTREGQRREIGIKGGAGSSSLLQSLLGI